MFDQAYLSKYVRTPAMKCSSPTQATSWRSTAAPLAYVIPSKLVLAVSRSGASAAMGCVVGSWSWR